MEISPLIANRRQRSSTTRELYLVPPHPEIPYPSEALDHMTRIPFA
jgi:hypothetical protein